MGYTFHGMNFGQFALWFLRIVFLDGQWSALLYASSSKDGRTEVLPGCLSVLYMDLAHLLRIIFLLRLSIIMLALYFAGCVCATIFEYLTARLMLKLFGSVWWNYEHLPFNYKGILCLESTLAWGVLALFIFGVFNRYVEGAVKMLDVRVAYAAGTIIVITYLIDFTWQFAHQIAGENNGLGF